MNYLKVFNKIIINISSKFLFYFKKLIVLDKVIIINKER